MDWDDLRVFLAIVRTGSFGAAARALKLSHPTVSRRLQALETDLGRRLFQRIDGNLIPTAEGRSIVALSEQIEDATIGIERRLAGADDALDGVLRVTASDWLATWMLPPIVEEFQRRHPGVMLELLTGTRLHSLAHREADLAFRVVPFDEADVVQRRLLMVRFKAYAARSASLPTIPAGLGMRIIEDTPSATYPDVTWLRQRLPDARVVLTSNNRTVQAHACAAGVGIALLPAAIGDRMPELRSVDLGGTLPERPIWMGFHQDLRMLGRLRAFVDVVIDRLAE